MKTAYSLFIHLKHQPLVQFTYLLVNIPGIEESICSFL